MKGLYTFDTSVIISRGPAELPGRLGSFLWSSVVLMELAANANDENQRKIYDRLAVDYKRDNSLIVPDADDWMLASKILFWLTRDRRKSEGGKLARLRPGASQRMALDSLMAVSTMRWNATLVVENWEDFKAIKHHCKRLKIVKASTVLS